MFAIEDANDDYLAPRTVGRKKSPLRRTMEKLQPGKMFRVPADWIDNPQVLYQAAYNTSKLTGIKYSIRKEGSDYIVVALKPNGDIGFIPDPDLADDDDSDFLS